MQTINDDILLQNDSRYNFRNIFNLQFFFINIKKGPILSFSRERFDLYYRFHAYHYRLPKRNIYNQTLIFSFSNSCEFEINYAKGKLVRSWLNLLSFVLNIVWTHLNELFPYKSQPRFQAFTLLVKSPGM